MSSRLIFIESNTTGTGMLALHRARALGLTPVLLTSAPGRYRGLDEAAPEILLCDTNDESAIRSAADLCLDVAGVTTTSEFYLPAVAVLARALGLPGNPPDVMRLCRDKAGVRRALANAGVPQPLFAVVRQTDDVAAAVEHVGLPCVVKPVGDSGSQDVRLCADLPEVVAHTGKILAVHTNGRGQPTARAVLLEEYLRAPEFSVEMFSRDGDATCLGVTAKFLTGHPYFVEARHIHPAPVEPNQARVMVSTVRRALAALGVREGPSHTEVKLRPDGAYIVEVNARLAGGMIPELIRLATGVDVLEQQLRAAVGIPVSLGAAQRGYAGIDFLTAGQPGVLTEVRGVRAARAVPGVVDVTVTAAAGARVSVPRTAYDRLGYIIASGASPNLVSQCLDRAAGLLRTLVRPAVEGNSR